MGRTEARVTPGMFSGQGAGLAAGPAPCALPAGRAGLPPAQRAAESLLSSRRGNGVYCSVVIFQKVCIPSVFENGTYATSISRCPEVLRCFIELLVLFPDSVYEPVLSSWESCKEDKGQIVIQLTCIKCPPCRGPALRARGTKINNKGLTAWKKPTV